MAICSGGRHRCLAYSLQVHELEQQLEDTIGYLSGVESDADSLQTALDQPSTSSSGQLDNEAESLLSASAATTPQVRHPSLLEAPEKYIHKTSIPVPQDSLASEVLRE